MAKQTNLAKRIFAIVISALLLSSMGICAVAADDTNAWLNDAKWGFEAETATIKAEWKEAEVDAFYNDSVFVTSDAKGVRSGSQGLKLVADGIDFTKVGVKTEFQNGVSGKTLAMEGFIKTENLTGDAKVTVQFASDADFQNVKHTITYASALNDWTKFHYYPSGDGTTEYMKISINAAGGSGTVYLDDVGPRTSDNLIKNPSFDLTREDKNGEETVTIPEWMNTNIGGRGSWGTEWHCDTLGNGSLKKTVAVYAQPSLWQPAEPLHKMQSGDVYKFSVQFKCDDPTQLPIINVLYTPEEGGKVNSNMEYLAFEKASDADANGFVTYESIFTMPDKTHYGFLVIGPEKETVGIFDNLSVERLVAETAEFSSRGEACAAFWPGNKITATSKIDANVGDSVTVLMALYNRENNQLLGFSSEEKTFTEAGLSEASASLTVPKDTMADTLEAFVWRKGDMKPFAKKAILPRGTGEEVVVRKTEVAADVWGFETNSLSAYEVKPEGTWVTDRVLSSEFTSLDQVIYGQSAIVNSTDEPNGVKAGEYALKLTGLPNRAAEGDTPWGKSTVGVRQKVAYQELAANSGKHITIEGYVKVVSLAQDAYVRLSTHYQLFSENRMQQSLYLRGSEITGSYPEWETGVWIPVRITMPNQTTKDIWFAFSLLGEGEVYFDDFHFVEDKNLIMNGDFRMGNSNGITSPDYYAARTIQNWTAYHNNTTTNAWRGAWKYDSALQCAYNSSDADSDDKACLMQNAVYSNQMVPGNTYEISVLYAEYDLKNSSTDGGGTPAVTIGSTTIPLTKTDKKVTRGTGANAREFTLYTADYTLPKDAAVPTSYQLKTSGLRSTSVIVWYADFAIYAY